MVNSKASYHGPQGLSSQPPGRAESTPAWRGVTESDLDADLDLDLDLDGDIFTRCTLSREAERLRMKVCPTNACDSPATMVHVQVPG